MASISIFIPSLVAPTVNRVLGPIEAQAVIRRQSCDRLAALLDHHSRDLLSNLRRFGELGDKNGAEMIRSCCINCFAHLAVLYGALSDMEPAPETGVDALCDLSLEQIGKLAQDMCVEEYTRHDLLLGVGCIQRRLS